MKIFGSICSKHPELNGYRFAANINGKLSPSNCVACHSEYKKSVKGKESMSRWRQRNPEVARIASRQARQQFPHRWAYDKAKRKAQKLQATPKWTNLFLKGTI